MYLLFGGMDYEESGGARDMWGQYSSYPEADRAVVELTEFYSKHGDSVWVWWHIYSVANDDIVGESE